MSKMVTVVVNGTAVLKLIPRGGRFRYRVRDFHWTEWSGTAHDAAPDLGEGVEVEFVPHYEVGSYDEKVVTLL